MKFFVALVFDCDAADWAHEYGLAVADAAGDFTGVVRRAVRDDGLRQALHTVWPMMHGHLTVQAIDELDGGLREELLHELQQARPAELDTALLTEIRGCLTAQQYEWDGRDPRWVIFRTDEWDNGYFPHR